MNNIKRIYLSPPHMSGREQKYIDEVFATNWIAPLGPHVEAFERELAATLEVGGGALALSSGTAAIHLALQLSGVGRGDRVFCSSLTFIATANPICYFGAEPVFIDSEADSWNMSVAALKRAFVDAEKTGSLPRAVIVVNLYGQSANLTPLLDLCNSYNVPLIEDAAESLGASYQGKPSGSFGKFGILSFNGNKIITTSGGGALVSDDPEALQRARYLATQARQSARHYEHTEVGYNYRLSNVLAGIGLGQLEVLESRVAARRAVFKRYRDALCGINGLEFMPEASYGRSTRWLTALTVDPQKCGVNRDMLIDALEEENIEARPVWKPLHRQPLYQGSRYYRHSEDESISDKLFANGLCLPSGSNLTEDEQARVIECIKKVLQHGTKLRS
ncbi:MAG TPA: DegT/DnrJ/EryC1/StrS family aminotransferase [Candidatus Limnocylindrales bacterium]|nr:DegT/DnrJ/EryC1/StrS family aminotransferase [Candidatus Limnocylindrales bacterium]